MPRNNKKPSVGGDAGLDLDITTVRGETVVMVFNKYTYFKENVNIYCKIF
jgi:hypothetical protein